MLHFGSFGEAVRAACVEAGDAISPQIRIQESRASQPVWLAMGQTDLHLLERVTESGTGPTVAAFLCARYLVVTPCFHAGSICATCFRKRFLSMPPPGLPVEAVVGLSLRAGTDSGFDVSAYAPALPRIARLLLKRQLESRSRNAVLVDQGGTQHIAAPLTAVHGCECRGQRRSPNRFTSFYSELFT